jgi:hypothetical protein
MEILIPVKSTDMPPAPNQDWFRVVAILFACLVFSRPVWAANAEENRRVLVLYEQGRSAAAVALVDREIREVFEKQTTYHSDLRVEYMETNLFVDPGSQQRIGEWYLQKYRDHQPDVGGNVISYASRDRIAGEDVLKIFGREKPPNIPFAMGANVYRFDWSALERWRFKERDLPTGSVVLNRPPTLWEAYGPYVSVAMVLLFGQTMLILELLRQRKRESSGDIYARAKHACEKPRASPNAEAGCGISQGKKHIGPTKCIASWAWFHSPFLQPAV